MVYIRSRGNIRKPVRRRTAARRPIRRRAPVRRRAAPRRSRRSSNMRLLPQQLTPSARFALAQLDPFEPRALGAKIPDTNTFPSIANTDTDIVACNAPGTGGFLVAAAFAPSYNSAVCFSTDVSASALTWPSAYSQSRRNATNVYGAVEAIRPVAHAIRISCPLAPTSTTGFVHIGIAVESLWNTAANTIFEYPTSVNQMAGLAHYKRFTLASLTQSPLTIINKWIDETGFRYDDPRAAYSNFTAATSFTPSSLKYQNSWGVLIVMIDGQTSTTASPLSVEHILHSEAIPKKDAFILGTPAAPSSPGIMSAVSSMVGESDFTHTEATQDSYMNQGVQLLQTGAAAAGERVVEVLEPIARQVGARAGDAALNYAVGAVMGYAGISGVNNQPLRLAG